jgi:arylsulfatase A-like enzyme
VKTLCLPIPFLLPCLACASAHAAKEEKIHIALHDTAATAGAMAAAANKKAWNHVAFRAHPLYVQPGEACTLTWDVTSADRITLTPGPGEVTGNRIVINPSETTTYTLTATQGSETQTATVRVVAGPPRPNILLVLTDDQGVMDTSVPFVYDGKGNPLVQPLNQRYRTPGMQALADQGMKFTSAHAAPICTPSRTSIMTGFNPTRHHVTTWTAPGRPTDTGGRGKWALISPEWRMQGTDPKDPNLLPRLLHNAGYRTLHVGKAHFGPDSEAISDPRSMGFDVNIGGSGTGQPGSYYGKQNFGSGNRRPPNMEAYLGKDIFLTEAHTRECNRLIAEAVADGVPFFAYHAHYAPHAPFQVDPRFKGNYPDLKGDELAFATLIEGCDQSLRDQLATLEKLGVAENTLVIFAGDNGSASPIRTKGGGKVGPCEPYRAKKGHPYDGGTRVPLLIAWAKPDPNNPFQKAFPIVSGGVTHDMVTLWDLYPTLLQAAGLTAPKLPDSGSLMPYLRGKPGSHRPQELVINFPHFHQFDDMYALLRTPEWKFIHRYGDHSAELYHLTTDIGEEKNLATDPAHRETLARLSKRLVEALEKLNYQAPRERDVEGNPPRPAVEQ